jgi:uncharacterized protein
VGFAEQLQKAVINAYGPTYWPMPMFHVMVKPGGPECNMACGYCYYRHNKESLGLGASGTISDELLEKFIGDYIQSQVNPTVFFVWQGGEPKLMRMGFYRKVVDIQKRCVRAGVQVPVILSEMMIRKSG